MRLKKIGAIAAIAFPLMQLISQGLIQVGGTEPPFSAPAAEIVTFFENRNPVLFAAGGYVHILSLVAFLWFLGALWDELRTAEAGSGWLSVIAVGSGLVAASVLSASGGWPLVMFRLEEGLDPQLVQLLFDEGNLSFANIWVSLGSLVLAVGLIARQSRRFPRWLGGASMLLAIGLFLARAVWTSAVAFAPYALFWVWMIALGLIMLRGSPVSARDDEVTFSPARTQVTDGQTS